MLQMWHYVIQYLQALLRIVVIDCKTPRLRGDEDDFTEVSPI